MRVALLIAAFGMAGLAFTTDPTLTTRTPTWHGRLHDASFVVLGLGLALAYTRSFWLFRAIGWHSLAACSAIALIACALGFGLKGVWFYGMLLAVCAWFTLIALVMITPS
jgi:hypothetical protein